MAPGKSCSLPVATHSNYNAVLIGAVALRPPAFPFMNGPYRA